MNKKLLLTLASFSALSFSQLSTVEAEGKAEKIEWEECKEESFYPFKNSAKHLELKENDKVKVISSENKVEELTLKELIEKHNISEKCLSTVDKVYFLPVRSNNVLYKKGEQEVLAFLNEKDMEVDANFNHKFFLQIQDLSGAKGRKGFSGELGERGKLGEKGQPGKDGELGEMGKGIKSPVFNLAFDNFTKKESFDWVMELESGVEESYSKEELDYLANEKMDIYQRFSDGDSEKIGEVKGEIIGEKVVYKFKYNEKMIDNNELAVELYANLRSQVSELNQVLPVVNNMKAKSYLDEVKPSNKKLNVRVEKTAKPTFGDTGSPGAPGLPGYDTVKLENYVIGFEEVAKNYYKKAYPNGIFNYEHASQYFSNVSSSPDIYSFLVSGDESSSSTRKSEVNKGVRISNHILTPPEEGRNYSFQEYLEDMRKKNSLEEGSDVYKAKSIEFPLWKVESINLKESEFVGDLYFVKKDRDSSHYSLTPGTYSVEKLTEENKVHFEDNKTRVFYDGWDNELHDRSKAHNYEKLVFFAVANVEYKISVGDTKPGEILELEVYKNGEYYKTVPVNSRNFSISLPSHNTEELSNLKSLPLEEIETRIKNNLNFQKNTYTFKKKVSKVEDVSFNEKDEIVLE